MDSFARLAAALTLLAAAPALAQTAPDAHNMRLVGYSDLQGRSAYQPLVHQQNGRWIAYIGHHGGTPDQPKPVNPLTGQAEFNGTSLIDVTDPAHPKYLAHIPAEEGNYEAGGAQMDGCATASPCPRATPPRSTCCGRSATRRTRSGTPPTRRTRCWSPASSRD